MNKTTVVKGAVLAGLCCLSLATPAVAGTSVGAPGAAKEGLVGPYAVLYCVGLGAVEWEDTSRTGPGFVVFNEDMSANTVSANVVLKAAQPHTTYVIRLIQNDGNDCHSFDATLRTNGLGNGQAQVVEPISPGATAVNVIVDTGGEFGAPTYRAPENYSLAGDRFTTTARTGSGATTTSP